MTDQPNCEKIEDNVYVVRTQAGFRRALRQCFEAPEEMELYGYPLEYPSVVFLEKVYNGGLYYIRATCTPINQMRDVLNRH